MPYRRHYSRIYENRSWSTSGSGTFTSKAGEFFKKVLYYFRCDRCGQKGEEREKPDEAHADHKAHFEAIV